MRTSGIRLVRKIAGLVLLLVNTILSVVSAVALYSVVEFASNTNNYNFESGPSASFNLTAPVPYIFIGNVTFNNTGLFDFDDFRVEFELNDTIEKLLHFEGSFGDINAGEKKTIPLNLTTATVPYQTNLWIKAGLTEINSSMTFDGYLKLRGKYVLSLFSFELKLTNIANWTSLP